MPATDAERQKAFRERREAKLASLRNALAIATRPTLGCRPVLLLEEIVENVVEIAWRVEKAREASSDAGRPTFVERLLRQPDLVDALEVYRPERTSSHAREFEAAIECIRAVTSAAQNCRSLRASA